MKFAPILLALAFAVSPHAFADSQLPPEIEAQMQAYIQHILHAEPCKLQEPDLAKATAMWEGKQPARVEDFCALCLYAEQSTETGNGSIRLHSSPSADIVIIRQEDAPRHLNCHFRVFRREGELYHLVGRYDIRKQLHTEYSLSFEDDGFLVTLHAGSKWGFIKLPNAITITRKFYYADPWDECIVLNEPSAHRDFLGDIPRRFTEAARRNDTATMKMILGAGYDLNHYHIRMESMGNPSLFVATVLETREDELPRVLPFLLAEGADIKAVDAQGNNILHCAFRYYLVTALDALICAGADVNGVNNEGETPLMPACARTTDKYADILLAAGADVHRKNARGRTALHYATDPWIATDWPHEASQEEVREATLSIAGSMVGLMQKLVAAGADVNAQDAEGNSALHLLALPTIPDAAAAAMTKALRALGADPALLNADGKSPRDLAQQHDRPDTLRALGE